MDGGTWKSVTWRIWCRAIVVARVFDRDRRRDRRGMRPDHGLPPRRRATPRLARRRLRYGQTIVIDGGAMVVWVGEGINRQRFAGQERPALRLVERPER